MFNSFHKAPAGVNFDSIPLDHIEKICRERQSVLQHIEGMPLLEGDQMEKNRVTWMRIQEATKLLEFKMTNSSIEHRQNDDLSHWLLKLAFWNGDTNT